MRIVFEKPITNYLLMLWNSQYPSQNPSFTRISVSSKC